MATPTPTPKPEQPVILNPSQAPALAPAPDIIPGTVRVNMETGEVIAPDSPSDATA